MLETDQVSPRAGVILLAHGSRDPHWREAFEQVLSQLQARHGGPCGLAYLQYCEPDLAQSVGMLIEQGCEQLLIVPVFLGAGAHVRGDVPELVQSLTAQYPGAVFRVAEFAGDSAVVREALVRHTLDALAQA